MTHRTIKIAWLPDSKAQWHAFTGCRRDAGRLWSWLVERHAEAREQGGAWPNRDDLEKETKRQYPNLHSQSVQQTIADFLEATEPADALRQQGEPYEYPKKQPRYRQVIWTNQAPRFVTDKMVLPCGKAGKLALLRFRQTSCSPAV